MTGPVANPSPIRPGELRRFAAFADLGPEQTISLPADIEVPEVEEGRALLPSAHTIVTTISCSGACSTCAAGAPPPPLSTSVLPSPPG